MVVVIVIIIIIIIITTNPLCRLLRIVPDRQSKRPLHLAIWLLQTPQRHEQRQDAHANKPLIPRWINPFILQLV